MKKIYTLLITLFISLSAFTQGSILNITITPASPSIGDSVTAFVNLQFNLSQCTVSQKTHSTTGDSTVASSIHCLGVTTDSCFTIDTFSLGKLQAGAHTFRFVLNSGFGGGACTPGIAPDDVDSLVFFVSSPAGIINRSASSNSVLYPNPFSSAATLKFMSSVQLSDATLVVSDITGRQILSTAHIRSNEILLQRKDLDSGVYFYRVTDNNQTVSTGRFMIE